MTPYIYDEDSGFKAALYKSGDDYILAFAGTDGFDLSDNANNGSQAGGGLAEQYDQAIVLTKRIRKAFSPKRLTLTGHSLGGGLASVASLVTGTKAVTFNAAGVNKITLNRYGASFKNQYKLITAYYTKGDPLSRIQDLPDYMAFFTFTAFLPSAAGKRFQIGKSTDGHSINDVCRSMGRICFWY